MFAKSEQEAIKWAEIGAGVIGTFGDALKPETFYEAVNETLSLGEATGAFVQMLEGKGQSVEAFNAQLQSLTTAEEKRNFVLETSNNLMGEAGKAYREQMGNIIAYRNSQTDLNTAMSQAGNAVLPLNTAINNLGASLFNALTPALNAIVPYLVTFVDMISKAVNWVLKFFSVLSGGKSASASVASVSSGMASASTGASNLQKNTEGATGAVEKLKRSTSGFDELNVMADNSSSGGGGGASGGGGGGANVGEVDTSGMTSALDETSGKIEELVEKIKGKIAELKDIFSPTITAWSDAFKGMDWEGIASGFIGGFENVKQTFLSLGSYVIEEFIPTLVNSFSENLAPVITDVFGFQLEQAGLDFQALSAIVQDATDNLIIPSLEHFKTVSTDTFKIVGDNWSKFGGDFLKQAEELRGNIRDIVTQLYDNIIKPVVENVIQKANEIWQGIKPHIDNIVGSLMEIGTEIMILFNKFIKPLVDKIITFVAPSIKSAVDTIGNIVKTVTTSIAGIIDGLITTIKGIVKFVVGVFTGDWKKAWQGVKDVFSGIWKSLSTALKTPVNLVIDLINGLISGVVAGINGVIGVLNKIKFTVPDWVPGLGGKSMGFNVNTVTAPKIPKLATGGIVTAETLACIGEGNKKEAVLPLEQNTQWMDILADRIASRNNTPSRIVLTLDGKELGWANINSINDIVRQTGSLPLAIV